jgi:hypothetical protein
VDVHTVPPAHIAQPRPVLNDFADCQSFQELLRSPLLPLPLDGKTSMRNFRARTDAKAWTLRERYDPAQPSSSAYLAVYGWVRGIVARGLLHRMCPLLALLGPREMSDLSPQNGPKQTLIRPLSPIVIL